MPLKLIIQNLIWDFLFFVRDITKNNSVFTLTISSGRDHPNMLPDQQDQGKSLEGCITATKDDKCQNQIHCNWNWGNSYFLFLVQSSREE